MSSGECPQIASARSSEERLSPRSMCLKYALGTCSSSGQLPAQMIKIIVFTFKGQLSGKL